MGYAFTTDDVAFLRSDAGADALRACDGLPLTDASRLADVATAREVVGSRYAAVLETLLLRRKAVSKLDSPQGWLFTADALQQASPSAVARHRAARLAGRDVHDVTCSIGADLVELARTARRCVGSDLDPVRLAMARHNCRQKDVFLPLVVRADALRPVTRDAVVVADPGRRDASGRRVWRPQDFTPPLDDLAEAYRGRDLVVKCAPGIAPDAVAWADEVELVSLDGQVREACLWAGSVATTGRRATVLRSNGPQWTITGDEPDDCPVAEPGEWIVDPDGAVVRAGLVRHYAARHGLWQLDPRIAYLSGDRPPPGVRAFRVREFGHYREKDLRSTLHRLGVGRCEILVRGLDVDPNTLRRRLKLRGDDDASVVLTRIGRSPTAFICRAEVISRA